MGWHSPGFLRLLQALREIIAGNPNIEGLIVASSDGFHIASILPWDIEKSKLSTISASLVNLVSSASRLSTACSRGLPTSLAEAYIKAESGHVIVFRIHEEVWLGVLCKPETELGLLYTSFSPLGGVPFGGFDLPSGPYSPLPDPIFPWRSPGKLGAHAETELDE